MPNKKKQQIYDEVNLLKCSKTTSSREGVSRTDKGDAGIWRYFTFIRFSLNFTVGKVGKIILASYFRQLTFNQKNISAKLPYVYNIIETPVILPVPTCLMNSIHIAVVQSWCWDFADGGRRTVSAHASRR